MLQKELLDFQDRIHKEADAVFAELNLSRLAYIGEIVSVGSYALRLMVRRDFNITVICRSLAQAQVQIANFGAELFAHPHVRSIEICKDTGDWNTVKKYSDAVRLHIECISDQGNMWNFDIRCVDEPNLQPDLEHIITLPRRISFEKRLVILALKHHYHANLSNLSANRSEDDYSHEQSHGLDSPADHIPRSWDIYSAVLDDDINDVAEFHEWYSRGKKNREKNTEKVQKNTENA